MILTGMLLMLLMHSVSVKSTDLVNKQFEIKNTIFFVKTLLVVVVFYLMTYFDVDTLSFNFNTDVFGFLANPLIYIVLLVNFGNQYLFRYALKQNETSMGAFFFSGFITMAVVPVLSYGLVALGFFEGALNLQYGNIYELLAFFVVLSIICIYYCHSKLKLSEIKRMDLFLINPILGGLAVVLMSKGMQIYDPVAFYMVTIVFNSVMWGAFAVKNKEFEQVRGAHWKVFAFCAFAYLVYSHLNVLAVEMLPVEYLVICRLVVMILISSVVDYFNTKKNPLSFKDASILAVLTAICLFSSWYFDH